MENCEGCLALGETNLNLKQATAEVERLEEKIEASTIENDAMSENLRKGMTMLEEKFDELEKKVTEKLNAIPVLLEEKIDKFLASLMRKIFFFAFLLILAVLVGYARPFLESALKTLLAKLGGAV